MQIKTFGDVDERSLKQLETCMRAGDAELGVLCADHHPGYSQPIGGAVAYEGYISPSGVGFDIACLGRGTRVTTTAGYTVAVEEVTPRDEVACLDRGTFRRVEPNLGAIVRGTRAVRELILVNSRRVRLTDDHRVLTQRGWVAARELAEGDAVLCQPYVGLPYQPHGHEPALLRVLGYVSGDGHLTRDGKRVSVYTTVEEDAAAIVRDFEQLGARPHVFRRARGVGRRAEIHVHVGSRALHDRLAELGSPVGKKCWSRGRLSWLLDAPSWARAVFLSAFASAEMTTPRVVEGRIPNLALKQADQTAAAVVVELLVSLGFRCSLAPSAEQYVVQILGGEDEQLRFLEEVGFCLAYEKRRAAAIAASVAWQRRALVAEREEAREAAWLLRERGITSRAAGESLHAAYGVPRSFAYYVLNSRGPLRRGLGVAFAPSVEGEGAWVPVHGIVGGGRAAVYDVVTGDPAESFLAEGMVVHNCGNKAAQTDLTRAELDKRGGVERIMNEITRRISFGMGVPAAERVDHPVLDKIRAAEFEPQRKLAKLASDQLGTVGSGNHFVDLFEDEAGKIWVGVHFGSRGFGHKTASGFLALAKGLPFDARAPEGEMDSPPILFEVDSELGQAYISAMELAGEYAYAGRDVVVDKVLEILDAEAAHEVHNNHNFADREEHFGRMYWVVRKGCTPAHPGQESFVGGTMGDESVILEGVASEETDEALHSTIHGAGRVMSRTQAAGRVRRRKRWACRNRDCDRVFEKKQRCPVHPGAGVSKVWAEEQLKPGLVDWPAVQARLREQGIVLVGGGADEAPEVYKRLPDVLAAHAGSVRVKHRLRPLGVAMAGRDVYDPYKD